MPPDELDDWIRACEAAIPVDDGGLEIDGSDAGAAVTYACRCLRSGESQDAAWAARRAYEALDTYLLAQHGHRAGTAIDEVQLLRHPLIQAELTRQRRDVDELAAASAHDRLQVIRRLRDRAHDEARAFFDGRP